MKVLILRGRGRDGGPGCCQLRTVDYLSEAGLQHVAHLEGSGEDTWTYGAVGIDCQDVAGALAAHFFQRHLCVRVGATGTANMIDLDILDSQVGQESTSFFYPLILEHRHDADPNRKAKLGRLADVLGGPFVCHGASGDQLVLLRLIGVVAGRQTHVVLEQRVPDSVADVDQIGVNLDGDPTRRRVPDEFGNAGCSVGSPPMN
nr:hypothetical protein [Actinokineospora xionganensis]